MVYYRVVADAVVVVHFAYVAFVVLALLAILIGLWFDWEWIRNFWFRAIHLLMIGFVVAEALLGITCPLTSLEHHLRQKAGQADYTGSFIGHWVHELLFFDFPSWVFTMVYVAFGAVVLAAMILAPPRPPHWKTSRC